MSSDAALDFFQTIVEPTVDDFLRNMDDLRLGCLACLVLSSMSDHYFHARENPVEGNKNPNELRWYLGERNKAFKWIVDVANATKHASLVKNGLGFGDIRTQEITVANLRANWPINGPAVMIKSGSEYPWLLKDLVEAVRDMWREKLNIDR